MSNTERQPGELAPSAPSLIEQAQRAAESWNARYCTEKTYLDKGPVESVRKFFDAYREQIGDGPFLDIGCGNGRNTELPARSGIPTFGIDASKTALEQLQLRCERENIAITAQQGSFHALPFENNTFEGAMSINVFQHNDWAGAQQAFAEVARVLKPGGLFLFQARSTSHPFDRQPTLLSDHGMTYIPEGGTKSGLTLHHYSSGELAELAATNRLIIVEHHEKVRRAEPGKKDLGQWVAVFRKRDDATLLPPLTETISSPL